MKDMTPSNLSWRLSLLLTLICFAQPSLALLQTTTRMTNLQAAGFNAQAELSTTLLASDKAEAVHWQLTTTEWQRYKSAMKGVAGRWYATLNPPEVLGVLARSDTERAHYAQLVVRQRKARLDRELAFNRAIHRAWVNEYPQLKPVRPFDTRPFRVVKHSN